MARLDPLSAVSLVANHPNPSQINEVSVSPANKDCH